MRSHAAEALFVKEDELQEFDALDPFNDNIRLRGFISHRSDSRYGALYISHVGDYETHQVVMAVPKFRYPFDRQGSYRFPKTTRVEAYEKLDGTSIFGYKYHGGGKEFITYKVRLRPVLVNSRFGAFLDMWQEMLQRYPDIRSHIDWYTRPRENEVQNSGVAFELFGRRNKHLILYAVDLDTRVLFGVNAVGELEPPSSMNRALRREGLTPRANEEFMCGAPSMTKIASRQDLKAQYRAAQAEMDSLLTEAEGQMGFVGPEGRVWYMLQTDGIWRAFKCKPETIETIHFASGGIGRNVIRATAYNVLETADHITVEEVERLLLEEYQEAQVKQRRALIADTVETIMEEVEFRDHVVQLCGALGLNIKEDARGTMQALAEHFPKSKMRCVYSVLSERA